MREGPDGSPTPSEAPGGSDAGVTAPRKEAAASPFGGIGRHAAIYAMGMLLSRAVSFVMLPIYLNYLTLADYGVMALVEMTIDFIAIVGGGQLSLGVFRFYHKVDEPADQDRMVATSFFLVGLMYSLVGAATFAAAGPLSSLIFGDESQTLVIRIAAANLAASSLVIVPMSLARVRDLSTLYVGTNFAKLVVALVCNILFLIVLGMGVVGIFLSTLIANSIVGVFLVTWLLRSVGMRGSREWGGRLLRYGVPLMGMQVATFIATFSDRYFLQVAAGEDIVGLYNLAYQFGFIMAVLGFTPVDMIWGPRRFKVARMPDRDRHLSRGFIIISVILMTTGVGILLYVEDVLRIMADPQFHPAAAVVPIILVAYVFQSWAAVQDIGILVQEQTKYLTMANALSAIVAVAGYVLLIPPYLQWGAAVATLIAFATRYGFTLYYSQRLWHVRYEWRPVFLLCGWAGAISAVTLMLPSFPILSSVAAHTGLLLVYAAGLWLLPVLDKEDREAAVAMLRVVLRLRGRGPTTAAASHRK